MKSGHAIAHSNGRHFRALRYDAEAAARPDWIWLPNALVDGAAGEVPPVELVRQAANPLAMRLLVNLYGSQTLDEDGGVHFQRIREEYTRHQVGQQGALVVWGFAPASSRAYPSAPFVACHLANATDKPACDLAWKEFWGCLDVLRTTGLVEFVAHLVTRDDPQGEIIHPVALSGTGSKIEQELGTAAIAVGRALATSGQIEWTIEQRVVMLAPVPMHMAHVQMFGIARLRYRPRTARTMAFVARKEEWKQELERLRAIVDTVTASDVTCNIKERSR